jgi:putative flippase GtrA
MSAVFPERINLLLKSPDGAQMVRFVLVGILNTAVGYGSFFILLFFCNYLVALVVSHFIGVTNSYLWNKYWTFRTSGDRLREFLRFNVVYLAVLGTNIVFLGFLVDGLHFDPRIGQLIVLPTVTLISFFGHKLWSFRATRAK